MGVFNPNNTVSRLIQLGADAMSNMYDVLITPPAKIKAAYEGTIKDLTFRCKGFTPPSAERTLYDRKYKTVTIKRPSTNIELDRTFELEFTLDAFYDVYHVLKAWEATHAVGSSGYVSNNFSDSSNPDNDALGQVKVVSLADIIRFESGKSSYVSGVNEMNETGDYFTANTIAWDFHEVVCVKVEDPAFTQDEGAALTVKATFIFGNYQDPQFQKIV